MLELYEVVFILKSEFVYSVWFVVCEGEEKLIVKCFLNKREFLFMIGSG